MSKIQRYLAEIGARGGRKSRRELDPEVARAMVRAREDKRAARRAAGRVITARVVSLHSPEASEPPRPATVAERLALLATLSRQTWLLTGQPLPCEPRTQMRVTFRALR